MPWKECSVMDERLRFVARLLDGEAMSGLCREFGISRKTGYKIFDRYQEQGIEALTDRSRRPVAMPTSCRRRSSGLIVACKREKPHWGARKIRELLVRRLAGTSASRPRAPSTPSCIGTAWSRASAGRVTRHRHAAVAGLAPNDLWCADFKGEFKLGNGQYCYPLTVTDHASRYLLLCEALDSTREDTAITAFEQLFLERGLPAPSAPTTACRSPAPTPCSTSPSFPCGGCGWASPSSASSPAIPSRTAATSACT